MKSTRKLIWAVCSAVAASILVGLISYNSILQRYQNQKFEKNNLLIKKK